MTRILQALALALLASVSCLAWSAVTTVGVHYHSTTSDSQLSKFITRYHLTGVRNTVLNQLDTQNFDYIKLHIWVGAEPNTPVNQRNHPHLMSFRPTAQDLANLEQFIDDVNNRGITLDLSLGRLASADEAVGCVDPADDGPGGCTYPHLGWDELSLSTYGQRMRLTVTDLISQASPGEVRRWIYAGDIRLHPNPSSLPVGDFRRRVHNMTWMLRNGSYGRWAYVLQRDNKGKPQIEFFITAPDHRDVTNSILNDNWHNAYDSEFPQTTGYRTMRWAYRSYKAMETIFNQEQWPDGWMPDRLQLGLYVMVEDETKYDAYVDRILDDAQALMFPLYAIDEVIIGETDHFGPTAKRNAQCSAMDDPRLESFSIWTTPYRSDRETHYDDVEVGMPDNYCAGYNYGGGGGPPIDPCDNPPGTECQL